MWNKTVVMSSSLSLVRGALEGSLSSMNDCDEVAAVLVGGKYLPGLDPEKLDLPASLEDVTLIQSFTTDHELALVKIYNVLPAGQNRLGDGIRMALSQLRAAHYPSRVLVILTDGLDEAAIDQGVRVLAQARSDGVAVWVIGIGDPAAKTGLFAKLTGTDRVDEAAVRRLANAGGGQALFARPVEKDNGVSLANAIATTTKQLGQGYTIGTIAPPGAALTVALPKRADATTRVEEASGQTLAAAAALPPPAPVGQCVYKDQAPALIAKQAGYSQVRVSVTDRGGKPVTGLKQADFVAHFEPVNDPIVYFHEDDGTIPKSIVIAIDTSGSMTPKIEVVRREFGKLIQRLDPCDEVALIAFSSGTFILQKLTTSHKVIERRLRFLHPFGQTALYDATARSIELLSKAKYRDRVLVLVTDGMDNASLTSKDRLITEVMQSGVPVYAIGIGDPNVGRVSASVGTFASVTDAVDELTLDAIASASGGNERTVPSMDEDQGLGFSRAISAVADQFDRGYKLGFIASSANASVSVSVPGNADYVVRTAGSPQPVK
ncbi:MAG: VWA domain-containing protein [Candidatus Binatus sp.]|uniref:VWA domain-containing protein n=1 Tax=Candidatus Binatus sp. TaxID=2811406 RepID=UPI00271D419D|nr:VWA domain-containing protein [Candidatus Binatus sp.]MDO8431417.1 VWA domain-containing protein [Candidatus Binatus sp.]